MSQSTRDPKSQNPKVSTPPKTSKSRVPQDPRPFKFRKQSHNPYSQESTSPNATNSKEPLASQICKRASVFLSHTEHELSLKSVAFRFTPFQICTLVSVFLSHTELELSPKVLPSDLQHPKYSHLSALTSPMLSSNKREKCCLQI